jgi:hypothetical protein
MRDSLKPLEDKTDQDHLTIASMYEMMYSTLPASKQRELLYARIGYGPLSEAQQDLVNTLDTREFFEEDVPKVENEIKGVKTLAANMGLPTEYQQSLSDIQRRIDAFDSLGKTVSSFSPFEAFADMTTLFGGSLPDVESERFNIIVGELHQIQNNQVIMMDMLRQIDAKLSKISKEIETVDTHLAAVALTSLESMEATYGLRDCAVLDATLTEPNSPYTFSDGRFRSFDARREHYIANKGNFDNCLAGLRRAFLPLEGTDISQLFQQDSETDATGKPISFEWSERYRHVLVLINEYANSSPPSPADQDRFLDRLFVSALHSHSITDMPSVAALSAGTPDTSSFLPSAEGHYLTVGMISKYVEYLFEYYPYFIFLNGKDQLQEPNVLFAAAHTDASKGIKADVTAMLVSALRLVNTAIAQQELLDSSLTLPAIEHALVSWKWAPDSFCANPSLMMIGTPTEFAGLKQTFHDLMEDNKDTLQLLGRRPALMQNWSRELTLETLNDPKLNVSEAQEIIFWRQNSAQLENPVSSFVGMMVDWHIGLQFSQRSPDYNCNRGFLNQVLFPYRRLDNVWALRHYAWMDVSINPDHPVRPWDLNIEAASAAIAPTIDKTSEKLSFEQHERETYLLLSLRRKIVASLSQVHGFDNLTTDQRKLAAYLIIHSAD